MKGHRAIIGFLAFATLAAPRASNAQLLSEEARAQLSAALKPVIAATPTRWRGLIEGQPGAQKLRNSLPVFESCRVSTDHIACRTPYREPKYSGATGQQIARGDQQELFGSIVGAVADATDHKFDWKDTHDEDSPARTTINSTLSKSGVARVFISKGLHGSLRYVMMDIYPN